MHPSKKHLREYQDQTLPESSAGPIRQHVDRCADCRRLLNRLGANAGFTSDRLALLDHGRTTPVSTARIRLENRMKQNSTVKSPLNQNILRAAIPLTIAALLVVVLAVPSFRALAVDFLGLFRVEQIEVVSFNPANLPDNMESRLVGYEDLLADQFTFSGGGEPVEVASAAEAAALAGFDVLLPAGDEFTLTFQPAGQASINVDINLWQAMLNDVGRADLVLPPEIDGETMTISIPNSVTYTAGECNLPSDLDGMAVPMHQVDCLVLVQMPNPTIEAPPGLPVSELGQVFLQFFGMSPEEAADFGAQIDWTTTLVLAVPNSADYRDVEVGDADGVLFEEYYDSGAANFGLLWVDGEMIRSLMINGDYTAVDVLVIANGLQ